MRKQQKGVFLKPETGPHQEFSGNLILDFPNSRTMQNKLLFKPPSIQYFIRVAELPLVKIRDTFLSYNLGCLGMRIEILELKLPAIFRPRGDKSEDKS